MLVLSLDRSGLGCDGGGPAEGPAIQILCLGAHADDGEIGAAGALLTLLRERPGSKVTWIVATGDDARADEARGSIEDLLDGIATLDVRFIGARESYLDHSGQEVKEALQDVRNTIGVQPDVIFTHYRHDRHQDHRAISDITWQLWRDHLILEYEIPKWDGDLSRPNLYVPLAQTIAERKLKHLGDHFASQRGKDWYDDDVFRGLMRLRGMECRAPSGYAEGFFARKLVLGV